MDIYKIKLNEKYQREIFGLGEVYEIMSVNFLRKKLLRRFRNGILYFTPNKDHSNRGYYLYDLKKKFEYQEILKKGYVDSPPWLSQPRDKESKKSYSLLIVFLVKIFFYFFIKTEFVWQGPKKSHMIYLLTKNKNE